MSRNDFEFRLKVHDSVDKLHKQLVRRILVVKNVHKTKNALLI
ncbi:hypothetical protein QWZ13_16710 [Reinekea marina]|nr:hypothetical protein [Reinekea marina]MDN3650549.1 hypothetical protein [Reinekea marina]